MRAHRSRFSLHTSGPGVDQAVGEGQQLGCIEGRARQHDRRALDDRLRRERHGGGVAVDRLVLERREHGRRVHGSDAHVLLDVEAAAIDDIALPGVHDAADALDADGLAFEGLGAIHRRGLVRDAGCVRHVLAQDQLDQRPVDHVGDGEELLSLRCRPQEYRAGAEGELGAAGQNRVGRCHADQVARVHLEPLLLEEARVLGHEVGRERESESRNRKDDFRLLRLSRGGTEPNGQCRGRSTANLFAHLNISSSRTIVAALELL